MLKIVAGTNVLISATISNGYEYQLLKLVKLKKVDLILSYDILWEFEDVLKRPKFGFSRKQIANAIKQVKSISTIINPKIRLKAVKEDPDDDKIVECAIEGKADYIISGDKHLLRIREFQRIKIVNAK